MIDTKTAVETLTVNGQEIGIDHLGYPVVTETGVRCANHGRGPAMRHSGVEAVRMCFAIAAEQEARIAEEVRAERLNERFFEEGF